MSILWIYIIGAFVTTFILPSYLYLTTPQDKRQADTDLTKLDPWFPILFSLFWPIGATYIVYHFIYPYKITDWINHPVMPNRRFFQKPNRNLTKS